MNEASQTRPLIVSEPLLLPLFPCLSISQQCRHLKPAKENTSPASYYWWGSQLVCLAGGVGLTEAVQRVFHIIQRGMSLPELHFVARLGVRK